jgi:histidinol dehydrogenase
MLKRRPLSVQFIELAKIGEAHRRRLCRRSSVDLASVTAAVAPLLEEVRTRGDAAVLELAQRFDHATMSAGDLRVSPEAMDDALAQLPHNLRDALEASIRNITRFHEARLDPPAWEIEIMPGIRAGERTVPIASAGLYIPRGKGSFPSMMMMAGVPAKVAGVERVVVVTPPDVNGKADPATLAVCRMIGVEEVYAVGGVQAIAALAFGVETIPKVDKIVGPGSAYVLAAKLLVSTEIDVGLPAGPSEAVILADETADPLTASIDLLIEAEHGPDSSAYLVTTDPELADQALQTLPKLVERLPEPRRGFCERVLSESGGVILAPDIESAIQFINDFAPEHLQILTRSPETLLDHVRYAGEALLGPFTPGTLANYSIGPNAILPTSGFARTASALSVRDFTRRMSYALVEEAGFKALAPKTLELARYEGFVAHARALEHRLGNNGSSRGER